MGWARILACRGLGQPGGRRSSRGRAHRSGNLAAGTATRAPPPRPFRVSGNPRAMDRLTHGQRRGTCNMAHGSPPRSWLARFLGTARHLGQHVAVTAGRRAPAFEVAVPLGTGVARGVRHRACRPPSKRRLSPGAKRPLGLARARSSRSLSDRRSPPHNRGPSGQCATIQCITSTVPSAGAKRASSWVIRRHRVMPCPQAARAIRQAGPRTIAQADGPLPPIWHAFDAPNQGGADL